jgi:hypothetical protein
MFVKQKNNRCLITFPVFHLPIHTMRMEFVEIKLEEPGI